MNPDQLAYLIGLVANGHSDVFSLIRGFGNLLLAGINLEKNPAKSIYHSAAAGSHFDKYKAYSSARKTLSAQLEYIADNKRHFPLQFADRVNIDDTAGLEHLLERTAVDESTEWGTVIRAGMHDGAAVIEEIKDSHLAEDEGYVSSRSEDQVRFDLLKILENDYNGLQHYHTTTWCVNFAINLIDRCLGSYTRVNLLTFNCNGPEVIGFNGQFVYIPKVRDDSLKSKKELVRAAPADILRYLGHVHI